jgi:hypothetical protein
VGFGAGGWVHRVVDGGMGGLVSDRGMAMDLIESLKKLEEYVHACWAGKVGTVLFDEKLTAEELMVVYSYRSMMSEQAS